MSPITEEKTSKAKDKLGTFLKIMGKKVYARPKEQTIKVGEIELITPDTVKDSPEIAEVIAVGEKVKDIKIGDTIVFKRGYAAKNEFEGETFLVMEDYNIYGVGDTAESMKAYGERVFLEWEYQNATYAGTNLVVPESHNNKHYTGVVLSTGSKIKELSVGDRVFFDRFCSPGKFEENGKRYVFIRESDALAIIPARGEAA